MVVQPSEGLLTESFHSHNRNARRYVHCPQFNLITTLLIQLDATNIDFLNQFPWMDPVPDLVHLGKWRTRNGIPCSFRGANADTDHFMDPNLDPESHILKVLIVLKIAIISFINMMYKSYK